MTNQNSKLAKHNTKSVKLGTYNTFLALIVIAVAIVINLVVSQLPSNITKLDTTASAIYSLSDETKDLVRDVKEKVTFYLLSTTGSEDDTVLELLNRYKALNSNITVETVDPTLRPTFVSKYTDTNLYANSVIVESDKRFKIVSCNDIYVVSYTEEEYYNYYTYGVEPTGTTSFAAESEFTSALDYVTTDILPTLYMLQGHGESPFSDACLTYIDAENVATADLQLLSFEAVPADATCVMLNNPTNDITNDEYEMLLSYVQGGGKLILISDVTYYSAADMPNIAKLAAYFGLQSADGIVMEGNSSNYYRSKNILLPTLDASSISDTLGNANIYVMVYTAHGITKTDTGGTGTVYPLLTTTPSSYLKNKDTQTTEKEDGDASGPFYVGALVSDDTTGAGFVWYSCGNLLNDNIDYSVNYGNSSVFMATVSKLCAKTSSISILAKSLSVAALSVSEGQANLIGFVVTILIPIVFVVVGLLIWLKRRKK